MLEYYRIIYSFSLSSFLYPLSNLIILNRGLEEIRFVIYFHQLHSFSALPHSYGTQNFVVVSTSVTGQHPEQLQFVLARARAHTHARRHKRAHTHTHTYTLLYILILNSHLQLGLPFIFLPSEILTNILKRVLVLSYIQYL
jgi:hypothetical protein